MRNTPKKVAILAIAAFALLAGRLVAWADDPALSKLLAGPPAHLGKELPAESYVKFEVRKLKKAKVLWRNVEALKARGIKVPDLNDAEALAKFDAEVLGHVGYAVFEEGMNPADFEEETREWSADRYGGGGLGNNNGTGRGGVTGEVMIKGSGPTPLVGNKGSHAHGGLNFREGQADIVMGEMFNRELPYGANRILFALDTGLNLPGEGRRMMIVREDPIRPAHFVAVIYGQGPGRIGDDERMEAAGPYLVKALPPTEGEAGLTQKEILKLRLGAYVDRVAEQYATAFAKKLYHGATSPSNFMIDGKFIDFSTSSALPGWGPVQTLPHVEAFGKLGEIVRDLVKTPIVSANQNATVEVEVPTGKKGKKAKKVQVRQESVMLFAYEFESRFMKKFDIALNSQFLLLAGFSEDTVGRFGDTPSGQMLAAILREVAFEPAEWMKDEPVSLKSGVPRLSTSKYDYAAVAQALAEMRADPAAREKLTLALPDEELRERLVTGYGRFFDSAMKAAPETAERELSSTMVASIRERNRTLYEFYRDKIMDDANSRMTSYLRYGNPLKFQKSIDAAIASEGTRPPAFRLPERCELALIEFKSGWWKDWMGKAQAFFGQFGRP